MTAENDSPKGVMRIMETIIVPAMTDALEKVNTFVRDKLRSVQCPVKTQMQMELAVEEIFVNISSYAYHPQTGDAEIGVDIGTDPPTVTIRFTDQGHPFNPLEKPDADTTRKAEEREPGGLGILLVKRIMDQVEYTYENGKNILTIKKEIK